MGNAVTAAEVRLGDLRGIGRKMLEDFELLGIKSVRELKTQDAQALYDQMCRITATRQDPCVLDTYRCAIEQARNPDLPEEQKDWWYWSRIRKAEAGVAKGGRARRVLTEPLRQGSQPLR